MLNKGCGGKSTLAKIQIGNQHKDALQDGRPWLKEEQSPQ